MSTGDDGLAIAASLRRDDWAAQLASALACVSLHALNREERVE